MRENIYTNIDEYIQMFDADVKDKLKEIREAAKIIAPNATETISWAMPTFKLNEYLFHFAAFKNHIGIYPGPEVIEKFKKELEKYKTSKGAIQFQNTEELPIDLIKKIIEYTLKKQGEK